MTKNEVKYRRAELEKKAGRLLNHDREGFKNLSQLKQGELQEILLELIGLDIKITSPDPDINTQGPRARKRKKHLPSANLRPAIKNLQLELTF